MMGAAAARAVSVRPSTARTAMEAQMNGRASSRLGRLRLRLRLRQGAARPIALRTFWQMLV